MPSLLPLCRWRRSLPPGRWPRLASLLSVGWEPPLFGVPWRTGRRRCCMAWAALPLGPSLVRSPRPMLQPLVARGRPVQQRRSSGCAAISGPAEQPAAVRRSMGAAARTAAGPRLSGRLLRCRTPQQLQLLHLRQGVAGNPGGPTKAGPRCPSGWQCPHSNSRSFSSAAIRPAAWAWPAAAAAVRRQECPRRPAPFGC